MQPLSSGLLAVLDKINTALVRGETQLDALLRELDSLWRAERPDDLDRLPTLLADLRAPHDDARLADAINRLRWMADEAANLAETRRGEARQVGKLTNEGFVYPVFFGTNREPLNRARPRSGFSAKRSGSVTYGRCDVWVPPTHRIGEIGRPFWKRWPRLQFPDDRLRLDTIAFLSEADFWRDLRKTMTAEVSESHGLVFLHGFRVSFQDAAIRAAQLGVDLEVSGATAFLSWPSQGTVKGYPADAAAIEASEEAITRFLVDFARQSGAKKIHLVAHSMGNRGLLRALLRLAADAELQGGVKFGQIFLAAPDVDRTLFLSLAKYYPQFSDRTTLYASPGDRAVAMSAWLHLGPRAGYFPPATVARGVERLDTVYVPDFDLDMLGHGYFAQAEAVLYDMSDLMQGDHSPDKRRRLVGHEGYWVMRR